MHIHDSIIVAVLVQLELLHFIYGLHQVGVRVRYGVSEVDFIFSRAEGVSPSQLKEGLAATAILRLLVSDLTDTVLSPEALFVLIG